MPRGHKSTYMTVNEMDALLIVGALRRELVTVENDVRLLVIAQKRDLYDWERASLPSTLINLSREELSAQLDSWISLKMTYEALIIEYSPDNWP